MGFIKKRFDGLAGQTRRQRPRHTTIEDRPDATAIDSVGDLSGHPGRAAAVGLGISDLRGKQVADEQEYWSRIGGWIENQLRRGQQAPQQVLNQRFE